MHGDDLEIGQLVIEAVTNGRHLGGEASARFRALARDLPTRLARDRLPLALVDLAAQAADKKGDRAPQRVRAQQLADLTEAADRKDQAAELIVDLLARALTRERGVFKGEKDTPELLKAMIESDVATLNRAHDALADVSARLKLAVELEPFREIEDQGAEVLA